MNRTKIPWATHVWNPIEGCSAISEGCQNCYAESFAHRFHRHWGSPQFRPEKLSEPTNTRKPARVFVCSTSDFFHDCADIDWEDSAGRVMFNNPRHTFMLLTKRPRNVRPWIHRMMDNKLWPMPNVWLGISAENQARYDERWPEIERLPFPVLFVSVEPMLGPVTTRCHARRPDWVIAGPETGARARLCCESWVEKLATECITFFDKRDEWKRREYPTPVGIVGLSANAGGQVQPAVRRPDSGGDK